MQHYSPGKLRRFLLLIPLMGVCTFIILYVLAAWLYAGGSAFEPQATGFSIKYNYWCDLFDYRAYNGKISPSRPVAIAAVFVIGFSLGVYWYQLPKLFMRQAPRHRIIQIAGAGSMAILPFLSTAYHEAVINYAGFLGGVAMAVALLELYQAGEKNLFNLGLASLILIGVNLFIYKTGMGLVFLAGAQKITLAVFFSWIGWINLKLYRRFGKEINNSE